jgi:hypothetical protein
MVWLPWKSKKKALETGERDRKTQDVDQRKAGPSKPSIWQGETEELVDEGRKLVFPYDGALVLFHALGCSHVAALAMQTRTLDMFPAHTGCIFVQMVVVSHRRLLRKRKL